MKVSKFSQAGLGLLVCVATALPSVQSSEHDLSQKPVKQSSEIKTQANAHGLFNTGLGAVQNQQKRVTTMALSKAVVYPKSRAPASVIALQRAQLAVQTTGQVNAVNATVGKRVDAGDVLLTVACKAQNLDVESAQIQFDLAKAEWARLKPLLRSKHVSKQSALAAKNTLASSRVELEQRQLQASYCFVTAPFSGVITERLVSIGQWLSTGQSVMTLLDTDSVVVEAFIDQDTHDFDGLHLPYRDQELPLTLLAVVPEIDASRRQQKARFSFNSLKAKPGYQADIAWHSKSPHLPAKFIQHRGQEKGYFIKREKSDVVEFIAVDNAVLGNPVLLPTVEDAGLIIEGRKGLVDGDKVVLR